jgi:hypothetical protein
MIEPDESMSRIRAFPDAPFIAASKRAAAAGASDGPGTPTQLVALRPIIVARPTIASA